MVKKTATAYRTISEAADILGLEQHVLRFWESKFPQISPLKRRGGRRFYRPEDIDILKNVQFLLHEQGYTIKGAKMMLDASGNIKPNGLVAAPVAGDALAPSNSKNVQPEGSASKEEKDIHHLELVSSADYVAMEVNSEAEDMRLGGLIVLRDELRTMKEALQKFL